MSQRQITELPVANAPDGSELMLVRQDIFDKKLGLVALKNYLQGEFDDVYLNESLNLSDVANPVTAYNNIKQQATTEYVGSVELATDAETIDGLDTIRATTPFGVNAAIQNNVPQATTTTQGKVELATPTETKDGIRDDLAVTPSAIKAILDDMFVGQVAAYAMGVAPEGWLKCNGQAVSRTTYSKLFSKIGITFGGGDGTSTFNLPDLRGEFVRGFDDTRGVDNLRVLGSLQMDAIGTHSHTGTTANAGNHSHTGSTTTNGDHQHESPSSPGIGQGASGPNTVQHRFGAQLTSINGNHSHNLSTNTTGNHTHTFTTNPTGGADNRPRNVALLYCIKY